MRIKEVKETVVADQRKSSMEGKSRRNDDETENNDSSNFDFGNIDFNQIASLLQMWI